jgi:hypothetical protein
MCYLETNTAELFNSSEKSNFLCIKIYKNIMNIFINEPRELNQLPNLGNIDLKFNLGSYIINNSKDLNFFIGRSSNGKSYVILK